MNNNSVWRLKYQILIISTELKNIYYSLKFMYIILYKYSFINFLYYMLNIRIAKNIFGIYYVKFVITTETDNCNFCLFF